LAEEINNAGPSPSDVSDLVARTTENSRLSLHVTEKGGPFFYGPYISRIYTFSLLLNISLTHNRAIKYTLYFMKQHPFLSLLQNCLLFVARERKREKKKKDDLVCFPSSRGRANRNCTYANLFIHGIHHRAQIEMRESLA